MTKNQIDYWRNQYEKRHQERVDRETRRANLAKEAEEFRSNKERERENVRTNRENEAIRREANRINDVASQRSVGEASRHNQASEALTAASLGVERERVDVANLSALYSKEVGMAQAGAAYANVAEMQRSNIARQEEINRANLINESIGRTDADTRRMNATASLLQAGAANSRASTSSRELDFSREKWSTAQLPNMMANTALISAQTQLAEAQTTRNVTGEHLDRVNAFNNVLGNFAKVAVPLAVGTEMKKRGAK